MGKQEYFFEDIKNKSLFLYLYKIIIVFLYAIYPYKKGLLNILQENEHE